MKRLFVLHLFGIPWAGLPCSHLSAQAITTDAKLLAVMEEAGHVFVVIGQPTGNAMPNKGDIVNVFVWDDRWNKLAKAVVIPDEAGNFRLELQEALDPDYETYPADPNVRLGLVQYVQGRRFVQLRW